MLNFRADYKITLSLHQIPESSQFYKFRSEVSAAGSFASLYFYVATLNGFNWYGEFCPNAGEFSGVFATPSEEVVCVVVKGQGYWVPTNKPSDYRLVPSTPIRKIFSVPNARVMVFSDYTKLVAFNKDGFLWKSHDLSWDGISICEVNDSSITGEGWNAPNNCSTTFSVDVNTGRAFMDPSWIAPAR